MSVSKTKSELEQLGEAVRKDRGKPDEAITLSEENLRLDELNKKLSVFAAIIESTDDAIFSQSLDGVIESWNPAAERLFGYTKEEAVGQHHSALLQTPDQEDPVPGFVDSIRQGKVVHNIETVRRTKEGDLIEVALTVSPIRDPAGDVASVSIIARDITERKQTQKLLVEQAKELEKANASLRQQARDLTHKTEEMEQFIYVVSHDLKSPLVTIGGFATRLPDYLERKDPEKLHSAVDRILRAIQRMTHLIDDLLELSRVGRTEEDPEWIDVSSLVRELHQDLSARLKAAHANLKVEDDMPRIKMQRSRIQQIFENLLTNAIKYGREKGEAVIEVGGKRDSGEIMFFVKDHGPGIEKQHQEKIFHMFRRLHNDHGGTGVGLAIVAKIAQLQGGRVWVESTPGQGATFWVALPVEQAEEAS